MTIEADLIDFAQTRRYFSAREFSEKAGYGLVNTWKKIRILRRFGILKIKKVKMHKRGNVTVNYYTINKK